MPDDALRVLVYSDDRNTRDQVRQALGRRPAPDLPPLEFEDAATEWAAIDRLRGGGFALAILDGEATPAGGLGVCRTVKEEIYQAPPVLVLIGRPQDQWLASWSHADGVVSHPIDPIATSSAVVAMLRSQVSGGVVS